MFNQPNHDAAPKSKSKLLEDALAQKIRSIEVKKGHPLSPEERSNITLSSSEAATVFDLGKRAPYVGWKKNWLSKITFVEKVDHIKAAYEKKLKATAEKQGFPITPEQRSKISLTQAEYDKLRPEGSLSYYAINASHTWSHALESAGVPILSSYHNR